MLVIPRDLTAMLRDTGPAVLQRAGHGVERECLRIDKSGNISRKPHPVEMGSPLTHPYITTDFSECQLEYTTRPHQRYADTLRELANLQIHTCRLLDDEWLWPMSMPARLPEDDAQIPIAQYGPSPQGKKKTIYRRGLANRYGPRMQMISGAHYNVSFGEPLHRWLFDVLNKGGNYSRGSARAFISDLYFHVARNFYRSTFFVTYLFGASPVVDRSFLKTKDSRLEDLDDDSWYAPFATSLRLSDIGYTNEAQREFSISYDSLSDYLRDMQAATSTVHPPYEGISVENEQQLNACLLQIENEHYWPVRPKQLPGANERPLDALERRGVRYLEVRALDLNPFVPTGIDADSLAFVHMTLLHGLLTPSPAMDTAERKRVQSRHIEIIWNGRKPGLKISWHGKTLTMREAGLRYCDSLAEMANLLDAGRKKPLYAPVLERQREKFEGNVPVPSARLLQELKDRSMSFAEFGCELAGQYREHFCGMEVTEAFRRKLDTATLRSVELRRELESAFVDTKNP